MQTDPIGYKDNMNLYAYVGNDPINKFDPTGMETCVATEPGRQTCTYEVKGNAFVIAGAVIGAAVWNGGLHTYDFVTSLFNESSEPKEGTRNLGDLEPIHDSDHPQNDPEIGNLSDEELGEAINNPENGDGVTVRGNRVLDGNTRINEAKARGWNGETQIPVIELPELPDNIDDNPLGPYGK